MSLRTRIRDWLNAPTREEEALRQKIYEAGLAAIRASFGKQQEGRATPTPIETSAPLNLAAQGKPRAVWYGAGMATGILIIVLIIIAIARGIACSP